MTATLQQIGTRKPNAITTVDELEMWDSLDSGERRYEYYFGQKIEKAPMKQNEFFIVSYLLDLFWETKLFLKGKLLPETDMYVDELRKRIPDLAYYTAEQIKQAAKGAKVVPMFVIEILSDSESFNDVETKVQDYFEAQVQTVWYINPKAKSIHCYTSPQKVEICYGKDICSAAPALPDYNLVVNDLFTID